jgi:DNA repair protein RecO (recombination protein O)
VSRYQVSEGIVIRRTALPKGDVVVTLLSPQGKWRGVARKGKLPGGNLGRLSLFHDVTVQHYRRREDDLALLVQVQLNGALPRLSEPEIYPYAHLVAELVDRLTVDVHASEPMYTYLASALRGLNAGADPEALALTYGWKLLQQAGLGPRTTRCVVCGSDGPFVGFDVAAGGLSCDRCATGIPVPPEVVDDLQRLASASVRDVLTRPFTERALHLRLLGRYCAYHVADLHSLALAERHGGRV